MRTAGIIAEYNPFHQGHRYHVSKTKEITGADYVIAVMSGNWVQRGEPALFDKYIRTKAALEGGADVVLEMPAPYAVSSAEYFAVAGVKMLHQLHCVDYISFGTEQASVLQLQPLAELFLTEPEDYRCLLQRYLKQGDSYPAARGKAVSEYLMKKGTRRVVEPVDLTLPNHILAVEYLKALWLLHSDMKPVTVTRAGAGYHDTGSRDGYASASGIREAFRKFRENLPGQEAIITQCSADFLEYVLADETVIPDDITALLDYAILTKWDQLERYHGVSADFADRLRKQYESGRTYDELIGLLHARNRTDTAVSRALIHILMDIPKCEILQKAADIPVPYARVLGFRRSAAPLLRQMRENSEMTMIQKASDARKMLQRADHHSISSDIRTLYQMDLRASALYEQILARKAKRAAIHENTRQQIIL